MLKYVRLILAIIFIPIVLAHFSLSPSPAIAQGDVPAATESGKAKPDAQSDEATDVSTPETSQADSDTPVTPDEASVEEVIEEEQEEPEEPEEEKEEQAASKEADELPKRFGYNFFAGARRRIRKLEEILESGETLSESQIQVPARQVPQRQVIPSQTSLDRISPEQSTTRQTLTTPAVSTAADAISGFVGPVEMMGSNVVATVPSKYVLGPGDKITLKFWSEALELQVVPLIVDSKGELILPGGAGKMVVRGMTLVQFQEAAREVLTRVAYKDLKLTATLDELRSIRIFIYGEAFRPGSYAVSVVTTLFNALYMCGGPSNNGSLRDIKLLRGKETISVDFYKVLMDGDSSQDLSLDAGDTIFIPPVGRTVTISGEVRRPTEYELKEGENLLELISMAGGIRPSGFLQRVQIDSVRPGSERIILDVDLSSGLNSNIFDGDTVKVFSIPSERMNTVTLEGKVRMPGVYELKEGMRVSDLIQAAQWLLGEAHMERADLLRLNPDKKTTKLVPVNLSKALAGNNEHNIRLEQWDRLIVYSKWDVKWIADRVVNIQGAVKRPGSYERSDGMAASDLLMLAGGTMPDAYLDKAFLMRLDERGELAKSIPVNLRDSESSPQLKDGDTLLIYTYREARWEPLRLVSIEGAVQNPRSYSRVDGMKVSDLMEMAGGLLPSAYPDRALLLRLDERSQMTLGFFISPKLVLQDDPQNNLNLKNGDRLKIYTYQEATWEPERQVTIVGAVQNPRIFDRIEGMRVSDLIYEAGGLLPNAYLERTHVTRFTSDHETYVTIPVNLTKVFSGDNEADILLQDEDLLTIYTLREAQYKPSNTVTVYGAVQRPDVYIRTLGMKLSDLLFIAGGLLPGAYKEAEVTRIDDDGKAFIQTLDVIALVEGNDSQDILLEDEDVVSVRRQTEFLDTLRNVIILGEVKYPGNYALKHGERLNDLIERAGGLTDRAYPEASVITRNIEYLVLDEQANSSQQVRRLRNDLNHMKYQREVAKALLIEQRYSGNRERSGLISNLLSSSDAETAVEAYAGQSTVADIAEIAAVSAIPEQAEAAAGEIESLDRSYQFTLVTPARRINSFLPTGRVIVNLKDAMSRPGTESDIILENGDRIIIPPVPAIVSISGAVIQPSSLVYIKDTSVNDYIEMVGGFAEDADRESVYVIKANGMVVKGDKTVLSPGDMIVVSTKVMVDKVTDRWGQVIGALKFTVTTLAMAYTIKLILEQVK